MFLQGELLSRGDGERSDDAPREAKPRGEKEPEVWRSEILGASPVVRELLDKAAKAKDEVLRRVPEFTLSRLDRKRASKNPVYERQMREHLYAGLRKAGIPE